MIYSDHVSSVIINEKFETLRIIYPKTTISFALQYIGKAFFSQHIDIDCKIIGFHWI